MDSLAWSRSFKVLSISRLYLSAIGFTNEQITALTDDDMQAIADALEEQYSLHDFSEDVRYEAWVLLRQKGISSGLTTARDQGDDPTPVYTGE